MGKYTDDALQMMAENNFKIKIPNYNNNPEVDNSGTDGFKPF